MVSIRTEINLINYIRLILPSIHFIFKYVLNIYSVTSALPETKDLNVSKI